MSREGCSNHLSMFGYPGFGVGALLVYALVQIQPVPYRKHLPVPGNAPIIVRGGSVRAVCNGCVWQANNLTNALRIAILNSPIKTIYLQDVGSSPRDQPLKPVPKHWVITLTFRDST